MSVQARRDGRLVFRSLSSILKGGRGRGLLAGRRRTGGTGRGGNRGVLVGARSEGLLREVELPWCGRQGALVGGHVAVEGWGGTGGGGLGLGGFQLQVGVFCKHTHTQHTITLWTERKREIGYICHLAELKFVTSLTQNLTIIFLESCFVYISVKVCKNKKSPPSPTQVSSIGRSQFMSLSQMYSIDF